MRPPGSADGREATVRIEPNQLEGFEAGPRFGVWWLPVRREPRGAVLCVQPLGAERAAARHTLACQAWRLAALGWAVLMVDLYGTGDSPGELYQATLEGWRRDLLRAALLARQRHTGYNVLWGVRGGALLGADIAVALDQLIDAYVFWQAPDDGRRMVETMDEGPAMGPDTLAALRDLRMLPPPAADHGALPAVLFLEIGEAPGGLADVSPLTCTLTEAWLEAGYLATPRAALASPFWLPGGAAQPLSAFAATEEFLESMQ
ncbi:MAG: hypothetical protein J0H00_04185 [Burkholderiales bacterium]|nr:hypothetical protein [Burkholderiales bacterium]